MHVLVKLPDRGIIPYKKLKITHKDVLYPGPVPSESFSVPVDTIEVFTRLEARFSSCGPISPLYYLFGPRQFGKTTIGHRLRDSLAADPLISVIFHTLTPSDVETEEAFWLALGRHCGERTRTARDFEWMFIRRKCRLWLAIDDMDVMFSNEQLTSNFLDRLRSWESLPAFLGFLAIGSYDLVNLPMKYKQPAPFNIGELIQAKCFSVRQMSDFFMLIQPMYCFKEATREAIMEYSSGAPGVFGSLVKFSVDRGKCSQERHGWEDWFKIQNFACYLNEYNPSYVKIQESVRKLSEPDWRVLTLLLRGEVGGFGSEWNHATTTLQLLGVVTIGASGDLEFSSEMMRRLCLEALPIRDIEPVASARDPLELLAAALRLMDPKAMGHSFGKDPIFPTESVLQFQMYTSIRGIAKANNTSCTSILAETHGVRGKQKRSIITISNFENGVKVGFEIKATQPTEEALLTAVGDADRSRHLLGIQAMFLVNFAPRTSLLEEGVHQVCEFPVKVVHVFVSEAYDEFTVHLQGGGVERRTVCCAQTE